MTKPTAPKKRNLIIFVEDDQEVSGSLVGALNETKEYEVRLIENGAEAFNYLKELASEECERAILLTDNRLPGKTGIEILEELNQENLGLPSVLLSGSADSVRQRVAKIPHCVALQKPAEGELIIESLNKMVESFEQAQLPTPTLSEFSTQKKATTSKDIVPGGGKLK
jgi:two-component system, LuxR family, response regulator TtrR